MWKATILLGVLVIMLVPNIQAQFENEPTEMICGRPTNIDPGWVQYYQNKYNITPRELCIFDTVNTFEHPKLSVLGTEYLPGRQTSVVVQLLDSENQPVNSGSCQLNIHSSNVSNSIIIQDGIMTNINNSDGLYVFKSSLSKTSVELNMSFPETFPSIISKFPAKVVAI